MTRESSQSTETQLRRRVEDLESQLAQAQKLLAIGSLAGGVAHDFNNLLTAILGYASVLREDPAIPPHVLEALDVIEKAAERASQLTAQILGFARRGTGRRTRVDVHHTLSEVADLLRHTIDKNIRLESKLEAATPRVMGEASQIFQVFLNLALNARDAMSEGGTLTLGTENAGGSVRVLVSDTGPGIPEPIRGRIFEPFFTTKDPGKGTGMGLTVVQSIVRAHGGSIELDDSGPGACFHVLLPLARDRAPLSGEPAAAAAQKGRGCVLVVDDEEVVRQVAVRMLASAGYTAVCVRDAQAALDYYQERGCEIDIVIVDLVMPGLSGGQLFEQLREIDPSVRIVLTSGYNRDAAIDALIAAGAKGFLQKPYRLAKLAETLRTALEA
ncbi:MAG: response regulator [Candidatus Solibacter usitatus]|nr:response regulator [Candidatus Solibacter usitatus]